MAYLTNDGDIQVDACLTDAGRMRLSKGDGSFRIVKFALSDDEINYALFNGSHANGSAYYDLDILQTPIFEAFANNGSSMKSKLVTYNSTNLLYLPVSKLNTDGTKNGNPINPTTGLYHILVDSATDSAWGSTTYGQANSTYNIGNMPGYALDTYSSKVNTINFDQGLDTTSISFTQPLPPDLKENSFLVQIDHRLGRLTTSVGGEYPKLEAPSFIDDDMIATYVFSDSGVDDAHFKTYANGAGTSPTNASVIAGPSSMRRFRFGIYATDELRNSLYYYDLFGTSITDAAQTLRTIDTIVRVQGVSTGFAIDVPVRFVRKV